MTQNWLKNKRLTTLAAIFGLLIFFHWTGLLSPLESWLSRFISPVAVRFYDWGADINRVYTKVTAKEDNQTALDELTRQNAELLRDAAELRETRAENESLRQ